MYTFLNSLSLSVPDNILETISSIDFANIDISDFELASIYTPLIIIYAFFLIFFITYTVLRCCSCRCKPSITYKVYAFKTFFFLNILSITGASLIINANLQILHGYTRTKESIDKVTQILFDIFRTTNTCDFIANNTEFSNLKSQLDSINNTIIDIDSIFYDYNSYYFTASHVISGVSLVCIIIMFAIINFKLKSLKYLRINAEIIIIVLLFVQILLVVVFRATAYAGTIVCVPDLSTNVISAIDTLNLGSDIEEVVNFYLVCSDSTDTPSILDELPFNTSLLDLAEDNALECSENNTLYCTNETVCGGQIPEEFDFFCGCQEFLNKIEEVVYDCTTINKVVRLVEEAVCASIAEPLAQIYVSSLLYIYSTIVGLVVYAFLFLYKDHD